VIPEAKGASLGRVGPRRVQTMQRTDPITVAAVEIVAGAAADCFHSGGLPRCSAVGLLACALLAPRDGLGAAPR